MGYRPSRCLLKVRLKEIGKNQQWLADKLNLPKSQISDYATTKRIMSLAMAKTVSTVIGCQIESLYTWELTDSLRSKHMEE